MPSLKDKTIFMSGGSRGIGLAIALRAAKDGANVVIAAKTAATHPMLPGTIYTAAEEIEAAFFIEQRQFQCLACRHQVMRLLHAQRFGVVGTMPLVFPGRNLGQAHTGGTGLQL